MDLGRTNFYENYKLDSLFEIEYDLSSDIRYIIINKIMICWWNSKDTQISKNTVFSLPKGYKDLNYTVVAQVRECYNSDFASISLISPSQFKVCIFNTEGSYVSRKLSFITIGEI